MKSKKTFYTEYAFLVGLLLIVIGVVFSVKANFGVSMIVAPAFVLYKFVNGIWSAFTMGMSEYIVQVLLLLIMIVLMRQFKIGFLFCFVTAVVYGLILDGTTVLVNAILPYSGMFARVIYYILGITVTAFGVSLMFHTYLPPQSYDYFVREVSHYYSISIDKFKKLYDAVFCVTAVVLSIIFFHTFDIREWWGTIVCTIVNGWIIGVYSKVLEKNFEFKDKFDLRKYFEIKKGSE